MEHSFPQMSCFYLQKNAIGCLHWIDFADLLLFNIPLS